MLHLTDRNVRREIPQNKIIPNPITTSANVPGSGTEVRVMPADVRPGTVAR